jgi:hypothetical protein
MEILVVFLLLLGLALAAPRLGVDSRSGPEWSMGATMQPLCKRKSPR